MKTFSFGQYYPVSSPIHSLDPRSKIILAVLYIVSSFLCRNILSFLLLLVSVFALAALAKIKLSILLKSVKPLVFVFIFSFLINVFLTKGDTLLISFGIIQIYREGLIDAFLITVRILVLVLGSGFAHACDIAFGIGHEYRNARMAEALGHDLQRDGLARAGCTRDESVPVSLVQQQIAGLLALPHPDLVASKHTRTFRQLFRFPDYTGYCRQTRMFSHALPAIPRRIAKLASPTILPEAPFHLRGTTNGPLGGGPFPMAC